MSIKGRPSETHAHSFKRSFKSVLHNAIKMKDEDSDATLGNLALDLQILICTLLHPSDILALRQTCKTLQLVTQRRVVWVAALHRVCLDNSLFLPSFPILDMSDAELEHAAMAPRRWINLCATFQKEHPNNSEAKLPPRTTRMIEDSSLAAADANLGLFIVPGGRYMVGYSYSGIRVWDLGYTSTAHCKLIASVGGLEESAFHDFMVQATPDGMGLIILYLHRHKHCSLYEIYPVSETPRLTHIAHLDFETARLLSAYLLSERVLLYRFHEDRIVFTVWDYRVNHSISFSAGVEVKKFRHNLKVIATKTSIIITSKDEILVWAIPALLPQPPDLFDHNPTHIPSLLGIAFPDGILSHDEVLRWHTMSHWYFDSSQPIYFDILCRNSKELHRFEIIVKPDLFDTSLHFINTEPHDSDDMSSQTYCICEDALVACWQNDYTGQSGAYTGLASSHVIPHGGPAAKMLLPTTGRGYHFFLCPASGRYVYLDYHISRLVVIDLF